jgi:cellulose synthase (UDP-forming)
MTAVDSEPGAPEHEGSEALQTVLLPRITADEPVKKIVSSADSPDRAETVLISKIPVDPPAEQAAGSANGPDRAETVLIAKIPPIPFIRLKAPARDALAWQLEQNPYGDQEHWRPELFTATVKTTGAVLPKPPSQRTEKFLYNKRRMWMHTLGIAGSVPFLFYSQLGFMAASMRLWLLFPIVAITPLVFFLRISLEFGTRGFDFETHGALVNKWRPRTYPSVDIMLPVCGESLEVLRNTWKHVAALQDAYPGVATAYVLDDAARGDAATMAAEFGFRYISRPNRGWFKKAGNLNYGLERSSGDFVLILDADFVPSVEMLTETLPYFEADPKLGILQTPQFFRVVSGQTFVERGSATSQEIFYRAIQVARDQRDAVVCCGTNAVYRRAALAENNGITLISHSEDAHTGIDLRTLGWNVRYLPVNLASGLCPADVDSFFSQQYRWCVGTISIVADRGFWTSRMPLRSRLYDILGFLYYVETAMLTILGPLMTILLCLVVPDQVNLRNYLLILPTLVYSFVLSPLWHRVRSGTDTWPVAVLVSWAHFFAFWDALRGNQMSWRPSGAKKKTNRRLWLGLWGWSLGMGTCGVALAGWRLLDMNAAGFTPIFISAVLYLVTIIRIVGSKWTFPVDA